MTNTQVSKHLPNSILQSQNESHRLCSSTTPPYSSTLPSPSPSHLLYSPALSSSPSYPYPSPSSTPPPASVVPPAPLPLSSSAAARRFSDPPGPVSSSPLHFSARQIRRHALYPASRLLGWDLSFWIVVEVGSTGWLLVREALWAG